MTIVSVADLISEYLTGVEGYKATLDAYMETFKVGGDEGTDRGHTHATHLRMNTTVTVLVLKTA